MRSAGRPTSPGPGSCPTYPAYLPDGEADFRSACSRFSREALETFLKIERPRQAPDEAARLLDARPPSAAALAVAPDESNALLQHRRVLRGDRRGLEHLHAELGDDLFSGDPARQVTPEYYYSGGGEVVPVTDLASATRRSS